MRKKGLNLAILSLLATLLIFTPTVDINAIASDKEDDVHEEHSIINKFITNSDLENDIYDIRLKVEGKNKAEIPPTDIIIVSDHSASMKGSRFEKTRQALNLLADKLLSDTENVTLGYVGFHDGVEDDLTFIPSSNKQEFIDFTENLDVMEKGTNLQAGIKKAKDIFASLDQSHQQVIIVPSDGNTTYSYKPETIAPIENNEVQAFGYFKPDFKVTKSDYNTIIGTGNSYGLKNDIFRIGSSIINNTGEATIGEILDFKAKDNASVYSIAIELEEDYSSNDLYTNNFYAEFGPYKHEYTGRWSESVEDGIYTPNEDIMFEVEYKNTSNRDVEIQYINKAYGKNDTSVDEKVGRIDNYVENTGDVVTTYYVDDVAKIELTLDDMIAINDKSETSITLKPNETYKIVSKYKMLDFDVISDTSEVIPTLDLAKYEGVIYTNLNIGLPLYAYSGTGPSLSYHSPRRPFSQGEYVLKNVSSDGVENSTYFNVDNVDDLADTLLNELYGHITDSIKDGTVVVSLGDYVTYVSDDKEIILTAETLGVEDESLLSGVTAAYDEEKDHIIVEGLNLSQDETIYIDYQIKLDKTLAGYEDETWYDTSEEALLYAREGVEAVSFPIPQILSSKMTSADEEIEDEDVKEEVTLRYSADTDDKTVKGISTVTKTFELGDIARVESVVPSRDGYKFVAWNAYSEKSDKSLNKTFKADEEIVMSESIVLKAEWKKTEGKAPSTGVQSYNPFILTFIIASSLLLLTLFIKEDRKKLSIKK